MTNTKKANYREFYEERSAIMEYEGGLTRKDAERMARDLTQEYRQRVENGETWKQRPDKAQS